MSESPLYAELAAQSLQLAENGLTRRRRTLDAPCGPLARVDGRDLVSFCSNDYLGLANAPELVEAACAGARLARASAAAAAAMARGRCINVLLGYGLREANIAMMRPVCQMAVGRE